MTVSKLRPLVLAALAFAVIGCDQGNTNPEDTTVRLVNVAPGFAALTFARGDRDPLVFGSGQVSSVPFKGGLEWTYDADTYNYKVFARDLTTGGITQRKSISKQVVSGTLYTFVLAQRGTEVQELILETQPPPATATDTQVLAAHAGELLPAMDIFLERPGTDITGAVPWGSLSFLGTLTARSVAAGDYELTLTAAGDRAAVLLKSTTFTLTAAASTAFVITPEANEGLSPVSVTVAQSGFGSLLDSNSASAVRVINAAADTAPRDVAFGSQFAPPLFAAVPFAAPTAYLGIAPGTDVPVNVTPPGNPGVLELDQKVSPIVTRRHTLMFLGDAGVLTHTFVTDDGRRILNEAQVRFYNAAKQFTGLDVVLTAPGAALTTGSLLVSLSAPGTISAPASRQPSSHDLYLVQANTTTIVAGPIPITLEAEGIYGVLATNGPDSVTATVTLIDDFQ
jgi:hypothetical protein